MLVDDTERARREAELESAIILFLRSQEVQPGSFSTRDAEAAIAAMLVLHLGSAYTFGAGLVFDQVGGPEEMATGFNDKRWINKYSKRFAGELVGRLKGDLPVARTDPAAFQDLRGGTRAETIAITELTKALSAGKLDARDRIGDYTGVQKGFLWVTEKDELVCKVCRPLHRKPEKVWRRKFPDGPPGHPNCRCDILLED